MYIGPALPAARSSASRLYSRAVLAEQLTSPGWHCQSRQAALPPPTSSTRPRHRRDFRTSFRIGEDYRTAKLSLSPQIMIRAIIQFAALGLALVLPAGLSANPCPNATLVVPCIMISGAARVTPRRPIRKLPVMTGRVRAVSLIFCAKPGGSVMDRSGGGGGDYYSWLSGWSADW